jgi:addiction module RelB/DinJ family antitoxin
MNNAVIQIRTDQELKESAQKVAEELGFSLSSLIKAFLKNVTRTKTVTFSTGEVPSTWLIQQMTKAKKDLQTGDYHKFDSETESLEFLKRQS